MVEREREPLVSILGRLHHCHAGAHLWRDVPMESGGVHVRTGDTFYDVYRALKT